MNVIVYVEGASDKRAMEVLHEPLLHLKRQQGVRIGFFETPDGDRKESLLNKVPVKAANIILNDKDAFVVALPDLYPPNKAFPHRTFKELEAGMSAKFLEAVRRKDGGGTALNHRFRVFCFKHDLEALVLVCERELCHELRATQLARIWTVPTEDQNHDNPPKAVVKQLFAKHGRRYDPFLDAPAIFSAADYREVADKCPQCFMPFVEFLTDVAPPRALPSSAGAQ